MQKISLPVSMISVTSLDVGLFVLRSDGHVPMTSGGYHIGCHLFTAQVYHVLATCDISMFSSLQIVFTKGVRVFPFSFGEVSKKRDIHVLYADMYLAKTQRPTTHRDMGWIS